MSKPNDPTNVRQGRRGKPVLIVLAVSLALAFLAAWLMWGAVADELVAASAEAGAVIHAQAGLPGQAGAAAG